MPSNQTIEARAAGTVIFMASLAFSVATESMVRVRVRVRVRVGVPVRADVAFSVWTQFTVPIDKQCLDAIYSANR